MKEKHQKKQQQQQQKQRQKRQTEAIVKGWQINDFVLHLG